MKSFKNLTNQLAEDYGAIYTYGSELDSLGSGSYDVHNIGKAGNLEKINQYIENFTAKSYFDPRQAIVELRAKLNTVGLDINVTQESANEGSFPVTLFGGSFGKTPQTPFDEFERGDGIVEKLGHGLQLDVEFSETGDGMFNIDAQIVPTGLDTRESVSEDDEQNETYVPGENYDKNKHIIQTRTHPHTGEPVNVLVSKKSGGKVVGTFKKESHNPESVKRRRGVIDAKVKLGINREQRPLNILR
jgi:hypothetical protein